MKVVSPKVYVVGVTETDEAGLSEYLKDSGFDSWSTDVSGAQKLCEVYGRLCYKSFDTSSNKNLSRIREGNGEYLGNIIRSGHGSVLEHVVVNFIFDNVSRVFTHELVRHRAGVAVSQESMRFVRKDELAMVLPGGDVGILESAATEIEDMYEEIQGYMDWDSMTFAEKKMATSRLRRILPEGIATTIGWSANLRTLRHAIETRTSVHAEEEIRDVFWQVYQKMADRFPNVFADASTSAVDGSSIPEVCFATKKV